MSRRQLALPLPRLAKTDDPFDGKTDWTEAKFLAAILRAGFRATSGGIVFIDLATGKKFDGVYDPARGRLARRETLAKIRRERSQS